MIWGITTKRSPNPPHLFPTVWAAIRHTRKIYEANNASRMFLLNNNKPYPHNQIVLVTYENDTRYRNRKRFMATERVVSKTEAFKATIIKMRMPERLGYYRFGTFASCLHIEQGGNTTSMALSCKGGPPQKKIIAVIGKFHSGQFVVMKPDSSTAGLELISDTMLPPLRAEAMARTNKRYQFEHSPLFNLAKQFMHGSVTMRRFPNFYSTMGPVEAACALSSDPDEVDPLSETFVAVREGQKLFKPARGLINPRILIEHKLSWSLQSYPRPEVGFPTEEDATLYSVVAPIGFDAP